MTYEEAPYEEALHEISVMAHMETKDDISIRISKDCYKILVQSLEKQIPEKPLHWDDCEQFYIECPCCGKRYDSRLGYKGCPYCLQAIRLE